MLKVSQGLNARGELAFHSKKGGTEVSGTALSRHRMALLGMLVTPVAVVITVREALTEVLPIRFTIT